jgi:hypothetical protein
LLLGTQSGSKSFGIITTEKRFTRSAFTVDERVGGHGEEPCNSEHLWPDFFSYPTVQHYVHAKPYQRRPAPLENIGKSLHDIPPLLLLSHAIVSQHGTLLSILGAGFEDGRIDKARQRGAHSNLEKLEA